MASLTAEPFSTSKTSNWVARAGGLPHYIQHVAHDIIEGGKIKDVSRAIAIAISQTKKRAAKGNKQAIKALAEWEALKAKNAAKKSVKEAYAELDREAETARFRLALTEGLMATLSDPGASLRTLDRACVSAATLLGGPPADAEDAYQLLAEEAADDRLVAGRPDADLDLLEFSLFDEAKHPRAGGKFAKKLGGLAVGQKTYVGRGLHVRKRPDGTIHMTLNHGLGKPNETVIAADAAHAAAVAEHASKRKTLKGAPKKLREAATGGDFPKVKCPKCDHVSKGSAKCPKCHHGLSDARRALNEAAAFNRLLHPKDRLGKFAHTEHVPKLPKHVDSPALGAQIVPHTPGRPGRRADAPTKGDRPDNPELTRAMAATRGLSVAFTPGRPHQSLTRALRDTHPELLGRLKSGKHTPKDIEDARAALDVKADGAGMPGYPRFSTLSGAEHELRALERTAPPKQVPYATAYTARRTNGETVRIALNAAGNPVTVGDGSRLATVGGDAGGSVHPNDLASSERDHLGVGAGFRNPNNESAAKVARQIRGDGPVASSPGRPHEMAGFGEGYAASRDHARGVRPAQSPGRPSGPREVIADRLRQREETFLKANPGWEAGRSRPSVFTKYDDHGLKAALADPQLTGHHRRAAEREASRRGLAQSPGRPTSNDEKFRSEVRTTFRGMSDEALAFQSGVTVGGIALEELKAEIARRGGVSGPALTERGQFLKRFHGGQTGLYPSRPAQSPGRPLRPNDGPIAKGAVPFVGEKYGHADHGTVEVVGRPGDTLDPVDQTKQHVRVKDAKGREHVVTVASLRATYGEGPDGEDFNDKYRKPPGRGHSRTAKR